MLYQFPRLNLAMLRLALVHSADLEFETSSGDHLQCALLSVSLDTCQDKTFPLPPLPSPPLCMTSNSSFMRNLQWHFITSARDRLTLKKSRINTQQLRLCNVGWNTAEQLWTMNLEESGRTQRRSSVRMIDNSTGIEPDYCYTDLIAGVKKCHRLCIVRGLQNLRSVWAIGLLLHVSTLCSYCWPSCCTLPLLNLCEFCHLLIKIYFLDYSCFLCSILLKHFILQWLNVGFACA
jgi:hypothetical protein